MRRKFSYEYFRRSKQSKKKAKPYAVVGGREVYDYDSLEKKVEIDQAEAKVGGGQVDLGK